MSSSTSTKKEGPYDRLAGAIAADTGHPPEVVKSILQAAPKALLELEEGDWVKTPLGVFRMTRRKPRAVRIPGTDQTAEVEEKLVVKLKPGKRLQRPLPA
jgi:nucleoid DNA-binding protein